MVPQLTVRIRRTFQPRKVRGSDRGNSTGYASLTLFKVRHEDADFLPVLAKHLINQRNNPTGFVQSTSLSPPLAEGWPRQIRTQLAPGEFTFLAWFTHLELGTWRFVFPSIGAIERVSERLPFYSGSYGRLGAEASLHTYSSSSGRTEIRMDAPSKTLFKQFIKIHKPHGSPFKLVSPPKWQLGGWE